MSFAKAKAWVAKNIMSPLAYFLLNRGLPKLAASVVLFTTNRLLDNTKHICVTWVVKGDQLVCPECGMTVDEFIKINK